MGFSLRVAGLFFNTGVGFISLIRSKRERTNIPLLLLPQATLFH
jgi:hypothetical protein